MKAASFAATPHFTSAALDLADAPVHGSAENTSTIVIGSGFSALAVAAELNRQGVKAIVVETFSPLKQHSPPATTTGGISLAALNERSEILRLLENYARRHQLDIRPSTQALSLTRNHGSVRANPHWTVHTATGTLSAHNIVFTRGALNQLRRVLHGLGVTKATELRTGMHALGLYLVGVGDLVIPSTQEILHQAKRAGASISSRVAVRETGLALA
ncbi:FAD-binding protein [Arthrobacter glacialis]|uniref:FAD-binding protein n=1 Tax=Arthrobacter glacialis TaxID=1664 RepID=UPI000CD456BA|nr:FAD-binding protein [Arthrobacter glacialis]POH59270.1 FAD-binding protein [Arthrobacter glacialis]